MSNSVATALGTSNAVAVVPLIGTGKEVQEHHVDVLHAYSNRISNFRVNTYNYAINKLSHVFEPSRAFHPERGQVDGSQSEKVKENPIFHSLLDLEHYLLLAPNRFKDIFQLHQDTSSSSTAPSVEDDPLSLNIDLSDSLKEYSHSGELFLGHYTQQDLVKAMEQHSILTQLAGMGFKSPSLIVDTSDTFQHRLSLVDASLFDPSLGLSSGEKFLMDWFLRRRKNWTIANMLSYQLMHRLIQAGSWNELTKAGEIRTPYINLESAKQVEEFLRVETEKYSKSSKNGSWEVVETLWIVMQNPLKKETSDRWLLPSQKFPGLGIGKKVNSLINALAIDGEKCDATLNFPLGWHNAVIYEKIGYMFLNPVFDAYVAWTISQLRPYEVKHGFVFVAWAWANGHVRRVHFSDGIEKTRDLERWSPEEQLLPCSKCMKDYFESSEWRTLQKKYLEIFEGDQATKLEIDLEAATELWKYSKDEETRKRANFTD